MAAGAALGAAALVTAVVAVPFPEKLIAGVAYSPEWAAADGTRIRSEPARDGQWSLRRDLGELSPWLTKATIAIEDKRFRSHPGVDPLATARALADNLRHARRVSGSSTLSMQLCRILTDRPRTWWVKLDEALLALRLERAHTKDEILTLYLNLAPYGGNRRGVEAAALAYFGKNARELTLAEAALLAGIPQSPERLRPDLHPEAALVRRAAVLRAMVAAGYITEARRLAADAEPLPAKVPPPPVVAPHLGRLAAQRRPAGARLTLDITLQREVERVMATAGAGARDLQAAVVIERLDTASIVGWVGALPGHAAGLVDHARRLRSPGSTLKTFAYALAFEDRKLTPESALPDTPADIFTWAPKNHDDRLRGEVTVGQALRESLNLPALAVTRDVGLRRARATAEACGVPCPPEAARRAGLSWVVGGAEVRLAALTEAYATLGRGGLAAPPRLFTDEPLPQPRRVLSIETCAALDHCLGVSDEHLPRGWENLPADRRAWFMWKTGTSSGGRDAWSVGHNGRYAIGVWVGRSAGAGPAALTSRTHAEPLLAALFSLPAIRTDRAPATPATWWPTVGAPEGASRPGPRILCPAPDTRLIATDGPVPVYPKTRDNEPALRWFLDDAPLDEASLAPLRLPVGRHELRCVDAQGRADRVGVTVEPAL